MRKVDNEIFVLQRDNSVLHSFNETGAFLWEMLNKGISLEEMQKQLCEQFDVGADQAQTDVADFVNSLESQALIKLT